MRRSGRLHHQSIDNQCQLLLCRFRQVRYCWKQNGCAGQQRRYSRVQFGQVIEYTDAKGGTSQFTYNMRGQLVKSTECSAQPTHYRDDKRHFLVEVTDAQDESLQYDYDKAGRPIEARGARGAHPAGGLAQ